MRKLLQGLLMLTLLIVSRRYRQDWVQAANQLGESCDACDASTRRIAACEKGGRPKVWVVKG
jgi:hypothetical protein